MHAEKCPLCGGNGNLEGMENNIGGTMPICIGCGGKGWVEVSDGLNDVPEEFWPTETTGGTLDNLHSVKIGK